MTSKAIEVEPLQTFDTRDEAEKNLPRYAHRIKDMGIQKSYRVKAAPMIRGRYKGNWGVWLVKHR